MHREEIPFWVPFDQNIPSQAVKGGKEGNQTIYIGRAEHSGSLTPGKVLEGNKTCLVPWGCVANEKTTDYEILVCSSDCNWVSAFGNNLPANSFPAGRSEQGETLYIGRYLHEGSLIVGKVQPSHRVCYIAFGNQELHSEKYEVFVV